MKHFNHLNFYFFIFIKNKWRLHTTYSKREVPLKALKSLSLFFRATPNFGSLSQGKFNLSNYIVNYDLA